jgi:flagellar hook-associated protein 3 FlgL
MMDRITTLMTSQTMLGELNTQLNTLQNTQLELSSGLSINEPSDNPYGMGLSLELNTNLATMTEYSNNVTDGTGWTNASSTALSDVNNVVQRVSELLVQASNGTNNSSDLNDMASEVNQLIEQVKADANTQYNGQYVFSGSASTTAPYVQDNSTASSVNDTPANPDDYYYGDANAVTRAIGPGNPDTTVQVSLDISQLLGSTTAPGQAANVDPANPNNPTSNPNYSGLLDTLRTIASDMQNDNTGNFSNDTSNLNTNLGVLGELQAEVGATQDRLQLATSRIQDLQDSDTQALSNTQDADMATTEINFSTQQAAYEAALKASASIVQESLVNFLGSS